MSNNRIGRLSLLVVALGIGGAFAAIPGVASADAFDPNDLAISVDGITLFQIGTATAHSAFGDIAIADGNESNATATGGMGDVASAFGAGAHAFVDRGSFDIASVLDPFGTIGGNAFAGVGNGNFA